jgi:Tol biopolymer transport system component
VKAPSRRASDVARDQRRRAVQTRIAGAALVIAALGGSYWWWASREPVRDSAPAWAPDGRRLVFVASRGGQSDLFTMNADGSDRRPLTETPVVEAAPVFSPDGSRVAFETDRDGDFEIYVIDADGGNLRRLTRDKSADHFPAWSPDGRFVAFSSSHPDGGGLWETPVDGADTARLVKSGVTGMPVYASDGHTIVVDTGHDVRLIDRITAEERRLAGVPGGALPSWSPDGQRVVFSTNRRGRFELFTGAADAASQTLLVSMPEGLALHPRWAPTGHEIAFVYIPDREARGAETDEAAERAVYVFGLDSQRITRLSP